MAGCIVDNGWISFVCTLVVVVFIVLLVATDRHPQDDAASKQSRDKRRNRSFIPPAVGSFGVRTNTAMQELNTR